MFCFKKQIDRKGFTLIELLVVISIISLLATLSYGALQNARAKARDARRVADIKQIATAMNLYYDQSGHYPYINGVADINGKRCIGVADGDNCWSGTCGVLPSTSLINNLAPYISNLPLDPSDREVNAYLYGRGTFARYCSGTDYQSGYWILWQPDAGRALNDAMCLGMGIYGCCGGAGPCGCANGYVCAYKLGDLE